MQLAIILILSIGGSALYFVAGLACGKIGYKRAVINCRCTSHRCVDDELHVMFGVGTGILWPLYILGRIATYIAEYDETKEERTEAKRQAQLSKLRHDHETNELQKKIEHEKKVNALRRQAEEEAALHDLLLEQRGTPAAERLLGNS